MNHRRTRQAGDTIVEVIIAVLIIATILAGAFTVTNHNTMAVRDSQEHAEALRLLQGQVELLRYAASMSGALTAPKLNNLSTPFCLDTQATAYQPAASSGQCLLNSLYSVSITSPTSTPVVGGTTTFDLVASWPGLGGGTNTVQLSYKVEVTP